MLWNADYVMSFTRNGVPFAETLPTNNINALVFCVESTVTPPYSDGYIQCKLPRAFNPHSNTNLYTHTVIHMKD